MYTNFGFPISQIYKKYKIFVYDVRDTMFFFIDFSIQGQLCNYEGNDDESPVWSREEVAPEAIRTFDLLIWSAALYTCKF